MVYSFFNLYLCKRRFSIYNEKISSFEGRMEMMTKMTVYDIGMCFFIYGFLGWCCEVAFAAVKSKRFVNRGFLNGPICPVYGVGVTMIVFLTQSLENRPVLLFAASAVLVSALEWLTGFLLEKLFHHKWWDYSKMPLNISGYICLPFSILWGVVCVLIVRFIHPLFAKVYSLLPVWLGIVLLILLCAGLVTDLCVTVSCILKLNKKLEHMEEIAAELHRISDQIGENIYQNMRDGMELKDKAKERMDMLKQKYEQLLNHPSRFDRRILGAFPKIESRNHKELLEEIKQMYRKHIKEK